jgi:signal transduction histidine kinase
VLVASLLLFATYGAWWCGLRPVGATMAVLTFAWLAPLWTGWLAGAGLIRSFGMMVAPFLVPALVQLSLATQHHQGGLRLTRWVWLATGGVSLTLALIRDPYFDSRCWSNCTTNVFLLRSLPTVSRLVTVSWLAFIAILSLAAAVALASRIARQRGVGWFSLLFSAPATVALAVEGAYAIALLRYREFPDREPFDGLFLAQSAALIVLALSVGAWSIRTWRVRASVSRMVTALESAGEPGAFEAGLARLLADPEVRVRYWLDEPRRCVDADGRPSEAPDPDGGAVTTILRSGSPIALVAHAPGRAGPVDFAAQLGSAARLAIDNERLRAQRMAELRDLRGSRTRLVEAADKARRDAERNLHDAVQPRLLSVLFWLRQARAATPGPGCERLDEAVHAARLAASDLRDFAHGIFPADLHEAGLASALERVADTAPVAVTVRVDVEPNPAAAQAIYLLVETAAREAADSTCGGLEVAVSAEEDVLRVRLDGAPDADYLHCADRFAALGGELTSVRGGLRAEVPCGS